MNSVRATRHLYELQYTDTLAPPDWRDIGAPQRQPGRDVAAQAAKVLPGAINSAGILAWN